MIGKGDHRDAGEFLGLEYPISLRKLKDEEGGGYLATIPQLGSKTFIADGETPLQALAALNDLCRQVIPELIAQGIKLPEPTTEASDLSQYSGSVLLRLPRHLHAALAAWAKRNGCSINKAATELLASGMSARSAVAEMQAYFDAVIEEMRRIATRHPSLVLPTSQTRDAAPQARYTGDDRYKAGLHGSGQYDKAA